MELYEITKGNKSFEKEFDNDDAVNNWAVIYFGSGFTIKKIRTLDIEEIIREKIIKGRYVADCLIVDVIKNNGKIKPNYTNIIELLKYGELEDAKTEILNSNLSIELKTKYSELL